MLATTDQLIGIRILIRVLTSGLGPRHPLVLSWVAYEQQLLRPLSPRPIGVTYVHPHDPRLIRPMYGRAKVRKRGKTLWVNLFFGGVALVILAIFLGIILAILNVAS